MAEKVVRQADCHPDRPHWARGFCSACYTTDWKRRNPEKFAARTVRMAPCHPDRPVLARDLCCVCYRRLYRSTPEHRERERALSRASQRRRYPARKLQITVGRYGLRVEDWHRMVIEHGGRCASCGDPTYTLHIDHDHATGRVRGLLCGNCNIALGCAKESKERLLNLIAYLEAQATAA